jgi:hypothetical protein
MNTTFNADSTRQTVTASLLAAVMTLVMLFSIDQLAQPSADAAAQVAAKASAALVATKS